MRTICIIAVMAGVGLSCGAQVTGTGITPAQTQITCNSAGAACFYQVYDPQLEHTETLARERAHQEALVNLLAIPVALAYCVTVVTLAVFLLVLAGFRSKERYNKEDNRSLEEIARIEAAAGKKPETD